MLFYYYHFLLIVTWQDADLLDKLTEGFPIKVDMVPKKGRGVVATRTLPKGSLLYTDEPYVSYSLFENKVKERGGEEKRREERREETKGGREERGEVANVNNDRTTSSRVATA